MPVLSTSSRTLVPTPVATIAIPAFEPKGGIKACLNEEQAKTYGITEMS